jgi:LytS/YehU family sensor histidine kinase
MKAGRKREQEANLIKNQMLEAESKMLKWQINPHFLFNTLNNIYSMSQLKSDKTPDAVHRLSEMLRYVIYDCNDDFVKLKQEVKYIQSYIDLLLLKDENLQNVKYDFSGINPELKITPMILIPFVENSFKHSKFEDAQKSWINIDLKTKGNQLNFKIENSVPEHNFTKDAVGGIGIVNVKKRLQMLYPGKHILNHFQEKNVYHVELILDLDDN